MAPKHRVIIDTDPGVDDVLALLLALSASPEELEVVMISATYGNVPLQSCLRNVMTVFHVMDKELEWRKASGRSQGYEAMSKFKPIVSVGADHPLLEEILMADYFHGADGLHNVHEAYPNLSPEDAWKELFNASEAGTHDAPPLPWSTRFTPSKLPAHKEMLRILRENPEDTITIVTIGPLTNAALAAAEDPVTFLRVKELVVMGGAIDLEGNITPVAEFNCYADALAAARVYALTSPMPSSTMPPVPEAVSLGTYPERLPRPLNLTLVPLDLTTPHFITRDLFRSRVDPLINAGSPLAQWLGHILNKTFDNIVGLLGSGEEPELSLHDPMTIWYLLSQDDSGWKTPGKLEDIRVETTGQWTRGMHIIDRRVRSKPGELAALAGVSDEDIAAVDTVPGDTLGWLSIRKGNRIKRLTGSPGEEVCAKELMDRIFG